MRIGWLAADLELARVDADAMSPEVVERLTEGAEAFLRACGGLSWGEWSRLTEAEQDAFRVAGDRIRREVAGLTGAAAAHSQIAEALIRGEDIDDVAVRTFLTMAAVAVEASLPGEDG